MLPLTSTYVSDKIANEVGRLAGRLEMPGLYKLSPEDRWTLQLYGDECMEQYGGLEVWWGEGVPRGVLKMVRGEGADVDEDEGSVSSDYSDM
jgi:hypothetical protein